METHHIQNIKTKTSLAKYLISIFPGLTRSLAKTLISKKIVDLQDKKTSANTNVKNGDILELNFKALRDLSADKNTITLDNSPIDILYEDANIIAIDKPAGIVVHPVYQHLDGTLLNRVFYYIIHRSDNPFAKPRPVHRLDKDTSGVILFSKNLDAHKFYSQKFMDRNIEKEYLAVVVGDFKSVLLDQEKITVRNNISKDATNRIYKEAPDGSYAETEIYFEDYLDKSNPRSILKIVPKTGRTHQIRVHLSGLGFPILGDTQYNGDSYKRMMLHASKLRIEKFDPKNKGQFLEINAPNEDFCPQIN